MWLDLRPFTVRRASFWFWISLWSHWLYRRDGNMVVVLDLFAGLGGWSQAFKDQGHIVHTLDNGPFEVTFPVDITTWSPTQKYDVVLASPPCESFSVMSMYRNWHSPGIPKTESAHIGIALLDRTIQLIKEIQPRFCWIENPRAMMRKLPQLNIFLRRTITYCQYGTPYMKPTDLWGIWPQTWKARPMCSNGSPCHESAPRGSKTSGIQSKDRSSAERAIVPYELSLEVCNAVESGWDLPPRKKMIPLGW